MTPIEAVVTTIYVFLACFGGAVLLILAIDTGSYMWDERKRKRERVAEARRVGGAPLAEAVALMHEVERRKR